VDGLGNRGPPGSVHEAAESTGCRVTCISRTKVKAELLAPAT